MAKILAVSGGIDSMVMLDIFKDEDIIVAHFDHGTRPSSLEDATFVRNQATKHQKVFQTARSELGEGASEETARKARYQFLYDLANQYRPAEIYTAHHLDDLIESIIINIVRGTGWRGLAILDTPGIRRPFLEPDQTMDKKAICLYAAQRQLTFREDPTNSSDEYLRNRIRHQMNDSIQKTALYSLWQKQKELKHEIDDLVATLLPENHIWQRTWFTKLDQNIALELLRAGTLRANISATRPQLENFRQAILTYAPGKYFNLPNDHLIKLTKTTFEL